MNTLEDVLLHFQPLLSCSFQGGKVQIVVWCGAWHSLLPDRECQVALSDQ
jgi:hypothetical protein